MATRTTNQSYHNMVHQGTANEIQRMMQCQKKVDHRVSTRHKKCMLLMTIFVYSMATTSATLTTAAEAMSSDNVDDNTRETTTNTKKNNRNVDTDMSIDVEKTDVTNHGKIIGNRMNGGGSPSMVMTSDQARSLEEDLEDDGDNDDGSMSSTEESQSSMEYMDHGHWGTPPTAAVSAVAALGTGTMDHSGSVTTGPSSPNAFLSKTSSDATVITATTTATTATIPSSFNYDSGTGTGTSHGHNQTRNLRPHNHPNITHPPPDAFSLTAMIQQKGSHSFFHTHPEDPIPSIPYLECNSIGTTTPPIPTSSASFRSFPKSAHPSSYTYTRGFIVPLSKIEIEVRSNKNGNPLMKGDGGGGGKRVFSPGDVIWVDGEYRMASAQDKDLSVLIIQVPKREGISRDFFGISKWLDGVNMMNCNDETLVKARSASASSAADSTAAMGAADASIPSNRMKRWIGMQGNASKILWSWMETIQSILLFKGMFPIQRSLLTLLGIGLSSLMTFFWIKVAPLQLAVGIGGLCMVAGGTLGIVTVGEMVCDEIWEYVDWVREQRRREELVEEEEEEEQEVQEELEEYTRVDSNGNLNHVPRDQIII